MATVKDWLASFRLRTLPLALSCILGGSFLAYAEGKLNTSVLIWAVITTILLQVLSNIANDYGDGVKGTDNEDRVGPTRAIQSKVITPQAMKKAMIINVVLAFLSGTILIYTALKDASLTSFFVFLGLGVFSILAAITYTVGKKAYGYSGLGDVFVFLFFGLIGVFGVYYLHIQQLDFQVVWMAFFTGLLSTAVLNMNNMRDIVNDKKSGKNTLVVKLGFEKSKWYHTFLILGGVVSLQIGFTVWELPSIFYIAFIPSFLFLKNAFFVHTNKKQELLDPELKKLALGTFATIILLWLGVWIY